MQSNEIRYKLYQNYLRNIRIRISIPAKEIKKFKNFECFPKVEN